MEQIFFRLHVNTIHAFIDLASPRIRSTIEKIALINALLALCLLVWLHYTFMISRRLEYSNCITDSLNNLKDLGDKLDFDMMRIHITTEDYDNLISSNYNTVLESSNSNHLYDYINKSFSRLYHWDISSPTTTTNKTLFYENLKNITNNDKYISNQFNEFLMSHGMLHIEDSPNSGSRGDNYDSRRKINGKSKLASAPDRLLDSNDCKTTYFQPNISSQFLPDYNFKDSTNSIYLRDIFYSQRAYLFSFEKGYLMLQPDLRMLHNISTINIVLPRSSDCFGPPAVAWLLHNFIGYDTVILNWAISAFEGKGHLYNIYSKDIFNLNYFTEFIASIGRSQNSNENILINKGNIQLNIAFKIGVIFTTLFLFFTTTTLVSFTLRETQARMLKFTFLLQHHISHSIPYAQLIFTHIIESLVFVPIMMGIVFFLFEFFSDKILAYMVLSLVWECEVFSVISLRTIPTIRFFPRIFFFYFSMFNIYFFSFPFGFSYLAFLTTSLFLQHSMFYFWTRHEIPAIESGLISALMPRVGTTLQFGTIYGNVNTIVENNNNRNNNSNTSNTRRGVLSQHMSQQALSELSSSSSDGYGSNIIDNNLNINRSSYVSNLYNNRNNNVNQIPSRRENQTPYTLGDIQELNIASSYNSTSTVNIKKSTVELSKMIQRQQMSAMLGIHIPNQRSSEINVNLDAKLDSSFSKGSFSSFISSAGAKLAKKIRNIGDDFDFCIGDEENDGSDADIEIEELKKENDDISFQTITKCSSQNDFGYHKNDFTVFGCDFNDD